MRMARLRRGSGHRSAQAVLRTPDVRSDGMQWHCGEEFPRDPSAQGRVQVVYGDQEDCLGHNRRICRKLRNLIEKSTSSKPSATTHRVAQWHAHMPVRLYLVPVDCGCVTRRKHSKPSNTRESK